VRLNCRGSVPEAAAYGASLALWQRRLVEQADAVLVPSAFARERLRELGAPLPWERVSVLAPPLRPRAPAASAARPGIAGGSPYSPALSGISGGSPSSAARPASGDYALVVSRLAPEKGVEVAIEACRIAGIPLVVAGEGPEREALAARAAGGDVRLVGRVDDAELCALRAGAAIALAPSRSAETFGLAVAEAMAAGLPVAASRVGALPELVEEKGLVPAGDPQALAGAIERLAGDRAAGERSLERVRAVCSPEVVAEGLRRAYSD
jgi:glycosyltransferase involved in cell wall biosynthesis